MVIANDVASSVPICTGACTTEAIFWCYAILPVVYVQFGIRPGYLAGYRLGVVVRMRHKFSPRPLARGYQASTALLAAHEHDACEPCGSRSTGYRGAVGRLATVALWCCVPR